MSENVEIKMWFKEPVLVTEADYEGEYSANADDYFMIDDDHIFEGHALMATAVIGGWSKRVVLKWRPTKKDLAEWRILAKAKSEKIKDGVIRMVEDKLKEEGVLE